MLGMLGQGAERCQFGCKLDCVALSICGKAKVTITGFYLHNKRQGSDCDAIKYSQLVYFTMQQYKHGTTKIQKGKYS